MHRVLHYCRLWSTTLHTLVQMCAVWYRFVQFGAELCSLVQNCAVWYRFVQFGAEFFTLVQNCTYTKWLDCGAVGELGIRFDRGEFTTSFTNFNHLSSSTKTAATATLQ